MRISKFSSIEFLLDECKEELKRLKKQEEQLQSLLCRFVDRHISRFSNGVVKLGPQFNDDIWLHLLRLNRYVYIPPGKKSQKFIMEAIKLSPQALSCYFDPDKFMVLEAVKHFSEAVKYVPKHFALDRDVVLAAATAEINEYPVLSWAECELDDELIEIAIKNNTHNLIELPMNKITKERFILALETDYVGLYECVKQKPLRLDEFLRDRDIVLMLVKKYGNFLKYVGEKICDDFEIVLEAVNDCGLMLSEASDRLRGNIEIARAAIKNNELAYIYVDPSIMAHEDIIKCIVNL